MSENTGALTEIKVWMSFLVATMDDNFQIEIEVSCGEDIENYMKLYFAENWEELFEDSNISRPEEVCDASFQGIQMSAQDVDNKHACYIEALNGYRRSSFSINKESLNKDSISKIERIREIINS
ncbi:hypothetical protein [Bacillus mobilis]|uniref:hypothetical protein n=1 Tax=Bacillus mobilis TaxID=2026190 RepID=UPI0036B24362